MNLVDVFHKSCKEFPHSQAVVTETTEYSYAALHRKIHGLAEKIQELGIKEGDVVSLWMENGAEFIISYYAIHHLGAVVVPIDPLAVPREAGFIIQNASSKLLITSPHYKAHAEEIKQTLLGLKILLLHGRIPDGHGREPAEINTYHGSLTKIIYTSGTTGVPKGAMLTHGNLMANIKSVQEVLHINHDSRMLCILPLFHCFAAMVNMLTPLAYGSATVLMRQFRPESALRAVNDYKITHICGVPSMFLVMARLDTNLEFDLSSLKRVVSGGAGLPPKIGEAFFKRFGIEIYEGYGLSEASPVVAVNPMDLPNRTGSIGVPVSGVEVMTVDENHNSLPKGEIGELVVKGDNVMMGYLNLHEETAKVLQKGWLYTGDMARIDEDGYIYIVDRKKEMILVRGHNVYPREVENILYQHPAVSEVAVVPSHDDRSGEIVRAVIVLRENMKSNSKEIKDFCRDKMAQYKIPKIIDFVPSLPKTHTGKILKRALLDHPVE